MKCLFVVIVTMLLSITSYAREDTFEANNIPSLKEYFQRNHSSLNPVEGIYHTTVQFTLNGKLVCEEHKFDIFIIESENSDKMFDVLFVGYSDPFDKKPLPTEDIAQDPGVCIYAGTIYQDGNTNRYLFIFCPFGPKKAIGKAPFILDLGADTFVVNFEKLDPSNFSYLGIPENLKNKTIKSNFRFTKI